MAWLRKTPPFHKRSTLYTLLVTDCKQEDCKVGLLKSDKNLGFGGHSRDSIEYFRFSPEKIGSESGRIRVEAMELEKGLENTTVCHSRGEYAWDL